MLWHEWMSQTISSSGTPVVLAVQCHLSSSFPKEEIIGVFPLFAVHSDFRHFFLVLGKGHLVLIAFVVLKKWSLSFAIWFHVYGSDGLLSSSSLHPQLSKPPEECIFLQAPVGGCFSFLFEKRLSFPVWPEIVELFMVKLRPLWLQNLLFQTYAYRIVGVSFCILLVLH